MRDIIVTSVGEDTMRKVHILADAAKYDVACTSSGVDRGGQEGMLGNARACGICHSFSADGRCISLLKILYTNHCVYDCKYCINRVSNDVPRAMFDPDELCRLTVEFYKRNYIEGLFLSSGVYKNPSYTMQQICETLLMLRTKYHFNGYIHVKTIPGASDDLLAMAGYLADRMSVNLELPTTESLHKLAPHKNFSTILNPMSKIQSTISAHRTAIGKDEKMDRAGGNKKLGNSIFNAHDEHYSNIAGVLRGKDSLTGELLDQNSIVRAPGKSVYEKALMAGRKAASGSRKASESGTASGNRRALENGNALKNRDAYGNGYSNGDFCRDMTVGAFDDEVYNHTDILRPSEALGLVLPGRDAVLSKADKLTRAFAPAGQSTQMIIGATEETDFNLIMTTQALYQTYDLKRVFYSAYIPINDDSNLPALDTPPPLLREHRLYQADFLLRYYGFRANELLSEAKPNFRKEIDPKCDWAINNLGLFPVEVEKASYEELLRVPGIGPKSAQRIVSARKHGHLSYDTLKKIGVVLKRAHYFITCAGKMMYKTPIEERYIFSQLAIGEQKENWQIAHQNESFSQLSLFDFYGTENSLQQAVARSR